MGTTTKSTRDPGFLYKTKQSISYIFATANSRTPEVHVSVIDLSKCITYTKQIHNVGVEHNFQAFTIIVLAHQDAASGRSVKKCYIRPSRLTWKSS